MAQAIAFQSDTEDGILSGAVAGQTSGSQQLMRASPVETPGEGQRHDDGSFHQSDRAFAIAFIELRHGSSRTRHQRPTSTVMRATRL
jgi:hypothetical protein